MILQAPLQLCFRWILNTVYFLAHLSDVLYQQEGSLHLPSRQTRPAARPRPAWRWSWSWAGESCHPSVTEAAARRPRGRAFSVRRAAALAPGTFQQVPLWAQQGLEALGARTSWCRVSEARVDRPGTPELGTVGQS